MLAANDLNWPAYVRLFFYCLIAGSQALLIKFIDIESGKTIIDSSLDYWIITLEVCIPTWIVVRSFLDQSLSGKSKL